MFTESHFSIFDFPNELCALVLKKLSISSALNLLKSCRKTRKFVLTNSAFGDGVDSIKISFKTPFGRQGINDLSLSLKKGDDSSTIFSLNSCRGLFKKVVFTKLFTFETTEILFSVGFMQKAEFLEVVESFPNLKFVHSLTCNGSFSASVRQLVSNFQFKVLQYVRFDFKQDPCDEFSPMDSENKDFLDGFLSKQAATCQTMIFLNIFGTESYFHKADFLSVRNDETLIKLAYLLGKKFKEQVVRAEMYTKHLETGDKFQKVMIGRVWTPEEEGFHDEDFDDEERTQPYSDHEQAESISDDEEMISEFDDEEDVESDDENDGQIETPLSASRARNREIWKRMFAEDEEETESISDDAQMEAESISDEEESDLEPNDDEDDEAVQFLPELEFLGNDLYYDPSNDIYYDRGIDVYFGRADWDETDEEEEEESESSEDQQ